jgi:hypothetical protein
VRKLNLEVPHLQYVPGVYYWSSVDHGVYILQTCWRKLCTRDHSAALFIPGHLQMPGIHVMKLYLIE